jgi:putative hydrolase of the HAD superfamily
MESQKGKRLKVLLFDIGGVLFDVRGGIQCLFEWLSWDRDEDQLLKRWFSSGPVRQFDAGKIGPEVFAARAVQEFQLPVNEKRFLEAYTSWVRMPYEGAVDLVHCLSKQYITASLSNVSELHWEAVRRSGLAAELHFNFPSFKTGLLKPDTESFYNVFEQLKCRPSEIVFFDDSRVNVDVSKSTGMQAHQVSGVKDLRVKLKNLIDWNC